MTKVVHTCDICKQEKSDRELAKLEIRSAGGINIKDANDYLSTGHILDICSDCLKKYGFDVEPKRNEEHKDQAERNRKTLEDKILDILSDLGVSFEG